MPRPRNGNRVEAQTKGQEIPEKAASKSGTTNRSERDLPGLPRPSGFKGAGGCLFFFFLGAQLIYLPM